MRIYTRSGDKGTTGLISGRRVPKYDIRVEAYGTCDEANSAIGLALSHLKGVDWDGKDELIHFMHRVQGILFHVGAELATPKDREVAWKLKKSHVEELEAKIDQWDAELPTLTNFILPSGHTAAATFHLARTVVRRAERKAVEADEVVGDVNPLVISYLNRLSDLLFVVARYVNKHLGGEEVPLKIEN